MQALVINDGGTSIGASAFDGCTALTSVTIGNSVTSIGNEASVAIYAGESTYSAGVCSEEGSVNVKDGAYLEAHGGVSLNGRSLAVVAIEDITVKNARLDAIGDVAGESRGLNCRNFTADHAQVLAAGAAVTNACSSSRGCVSVGMDIVKNGTIINGSDVSISASEETRSASIISCAYNTGGATLVDSYSLLYLSAVGTSTNGDSRCVKVDKLKVAGNAVIDALAESPRYTSAVGANTIEVDRGNILCGTEKSKMGSALLASQSLKVVNGFVLGCDQSTDTGIGVSAKAAEITGGRVIGSSSAREGFGVLADGAMSVTGGYMTGRGTTTAIVANGGLSVGSDMMITASAVEEEDFSCAMSAGKRGNNLIFTENGSYAKTASLIQNLNGFTFYFSIASNTLRYNKSMQIGVQSVCDGMYKLYYTSSNPSAAVVDSNGVITAVGDGTTTITLRVVDENNKPLQDDQGNQVVTQLELKCTMTIFQKIIRWFRNLFSIQKVAQMIH